MILINESCDIINISKGIDLGQSSNSKCMACRYWYSDNGFKFQDFVCNGCHDLLMQCINISDIAIILSLLKLLVIIALFMALANLMQLIHDKNFINSKLINFKSSFDDRGYI